MSTAYAIAAVSAVLSRYLKEALVDAKIADVLGDDVTVSVLPPDRVMSPGDEEPTQINIYLHQVTHNAALSNLNFASRDSQGNVIDTPQLSLNLHYLLTVYGKTPFAAEILLGHVMRFFHDVPVLGRDVIRKILSPEVDDENLPDILAEAGLAEQFEQIKITPEILNTEDMSRLWSAIQSQFRVSAAYQASVVLIDSEHVPKASLPVHEQNIQVSEIEKAEDEGGDDVIPVVQALEAQHVGAPVDVGNLKLVTGELEVTLQDLIGKQQRVTLYLNKTNLAADEEQRSYRFTMPVGHKFGEDDDEISVIHIPYDSVVKGTYLVRVDVDGCDSRLEVGADGRLETPNTEF
ncbi:MAG: DUF4255 domain-containing protein [Alphaproteobacteria bacterium]